MKYNVEPYITEDGQLWATFWAKSGYEARDAVLYANIMGINAFRHGPHVFVPPGVNEKEFSKIYGIAKRDGSTTA